MSNLTNTRQPFRARTPFATGRDQVTPLLPAYDPDRTGYAVSSTPFHRGGNPCALTSRSQRRRHKNTDDRFIILPEIDASRQGWAATPPSEEGCTATAPPFADPNAAPVLLDVTRLIELRRTGRQPNGIDRVCLAYVRYFAGIARAVVQHRGVIRSSGPVRRDNLFNLLVQGGPSIRPRIAAHLAAALAAPPAPQPGSLYLNVTHTDFDLPAHVEWIARHGLRPIYLVHELIPVPASPNTAAPMPSPAIRVA